MSFILVDYDHGCGGEYFSYALSMSPQCHTLERKTLNKRTKVLDVFGQEFLKINPKIKTIPLLDEKHIIVPNHQKTLLAKSLLGDCKSIRIQYPTQMQYHLYVVRCIEEKVLNSKQFGIREWSGYIKLLFETNKELLKKINLEMDNFDILLVSEGIEPTKENKQKWIAELLENFPQEEPDCNYDVVIEFRELIEDIDSIVKKIKDKLKIDIDRELLTKYEKEYQSFRHYGSILM
jgi:hypothetical protein